MTVDAYVSQRSYLDHVEPILDALPDALRGSVFGPKHMYRGYPGRVHAGPIPTSEHPLLVASPHDLIQSGRPKVFVAHGAEQTYVGVDRPEYCGGPGRELVDLFIGPRWHSVNRDFARYPRARGVAVGCPKLDKWARIPKPVNDRPVVAVAWHWDCRIGPPEMGTAFHHYAPVLADLAKRFTVLGHAHPRALDMVTPTYRAADIEIVNDPAELLARADVFCIDNSSLLYEMAAVDRPVIALNAPEWRRDIQHGLRFWSRIPGAQVDDPDGLAIAIDTDLHVGGLDALRSRVTEFVYGGMVDGHASERAASAILDMIGVPCA